MRAASCNSRMPGRKARAYCLALLGSCSFIQLVRLFHTYRVNIGIDVVPASLDLREVVDKTFTSPELL